MSDGTQTGLNCRSVWAWCVNLTLSYLCWHCVILVVMQSAAFTCFYTLEQSCSTGRWRNGRTCRKSSVKPPPPQPGRHLSRLQSKHTHRAPCLTWCFPCTKRDLICLRCLMFVLAAQQAEKRRSPCLKIQSVLSVFCFTDFLFLSVSSSSGICVCKPGVYGPKCDECNPGFFHFSSTGCRPCQCHNHTSYCHPQSGNHSFYRTVFLLRLFPCCVLKHRLWFVFIISLYIKAKRQSDLRLALSSCSLLFHSQSLSQ